MNPFTQSKSPALAAVLVLAWVAAAGCDRGDTGKPTTPSGSAPAPSGEAAPAGGQAAGAKGPQIFKLTPEQYSKEFQADQAATIERYRNGLVELSGTVEDVNMNFAGDVFVALRAGEPTAETKTAPATTPVVQCYTAEPEPWAKIARGQEATLRGSGGYLPGLPNIEKATIVSAGPSTAVNLSATELASDYTKGRDALLAKYKGKTLVVSGKVAEKKGDLAGATILFLEGDGPTRVRCPFGMTESTVKEMAAKVQTGQQVKVWADVDAANQSQDVVPLTSCRLITK